MALLGIPTALKEDSHCTTTKLVYGTTLRLPGDFFSSSPNVTLTQLAMRPNERVNVMDWVQ